MKSEQDITSEYERLTEELRAINKQIIASNLSPIKLLVAKEREDAIRAQLQILAWIIVG